jgi:iron complex transport system permease protein
MARRRLFLGILFLAVLIVGLAALWVGPVANPSAVIIWQVRLPRVIMAVLVGSALAAAGTVFQGVLRNPLADPFMLGTSSAAAAGVMLAGALRFGGYSTLYFMALAFALLSIVLVYRIAHIQGKAPIQTMILAGVIVSLFFNAAVFVFFSLFYRESFNTLFYLLGTLTEADPVLLTISALLIGGGLVVVWYLAPDLDLLTQGEETAQHLGVEVERVKKLLFAAASTMVAAAVAIAGMIGFVGLIVPHMLRLMIGPNHRWLIPAAALGGGLFLIVTDALARTVAAPLEIPVGALTALIGSPYFVYLLRRRARYGQF